MSDHQTPELAPEMPAETPEQTPAEMVAAMLDQVRDDLAAGNVIPTVEMVTETIMEMVGLDPDGHFPAPEELQVGEWNPIDADQLDDIEWLKLPHGTQDAEAKWFRDRFLNCHRAVADGTRFLRTHQQRADAFLLEQGAALIAGRKDDQLGGMPAYGVAAITSTEWTAGNEPENWPELMPSGTPSSVVRAATVSDGQPNLEGINKWSEMVEGDAEFLRNTIEQVTDEVSGFHLIPTN